MNESNEQPQPQASRVLASTVNPKIASDSGYGSNKSTQRSSGSSKSHESSVSSESSLAYPPHPNAPVTIAECQSHNIASPSQGPGKRQGKKKKSGKQSSEKGETSQKLDFPQPMDQSSAASAGPGPVCPVMSSGSGAQQNPPQIMSPSSRASSTHDSKALQMAALTHALSCMKKFHKPITTDSEINEESDEIGATGKKWDEYFASDIKVDDVSNEDTFAAVVSLEDGIIVYITPTISNILGFPKDMLVGRSFIDFVHPKDRMAFASHITCGMSFPMTEQHHQQQQHQQSPQHSNNNAGSARVKSEPFYCRLRQYRGLKTVGFGVVDKSVLYYPFKLTMTLKMVEQQKEQDVMSGEDKNEASAENNHNLKKEKNFAQNTNVHLVIVADRIKSAYQFPDEIPTNPGKFVTRHSASCHFGHMDSEAINYLGHLPQDLIGNSVLDYYHPEDMGLMKDIYEGVMQEQGKPFRSKPYRFRVYNGSFAMLETDWSCFINPWSWKLEFVIGQHRVLKGPGNPNVFMQPTEEPDGKKGGIAEEILEESKDFQSEIKRLLTEVRIRKRDSKTVTRRLSDPLRQQSSRRRKDLAALMETLLEGMAKTENSDKSGSQCSGMFSVMERDSVMLGEISPHHDDQSGSNQSTETPPSYSQLNFKANIERFFQSRPRTVRSEEFSETSKVETNQLVRSSDSDSKSSPNIDYSSGSNVRLSSGSNENESEQDRRMCASPLTEERLSRHNEAMEKFMIQRHRELRCKSSMTPGSHKECRHKHSEKVYTPLPVGSSTSLSNDNDKCSNIKLCPKRCQRRTKCKHRASDMPHGVKRMGNASWDGETHTAKQPHLECHPGRNPAMAPNPSGGPPGVCCAGHGHNTINLWPPFSISMTPGITTSTFRSAGGAPPTPIPANYPDLSQCFATSAIASGTRPGAEPGQRPIIPESISMSATTPSAPLLFLHSHHHPHHHQQVNHQHHQFVPQPVQLFPAGVVYQPVVGSCVYGQPSPIMMSAGFLSTMMQSTDQSMISQMESSQGEAAGTATLPKVNDKDANKPGPSGNNYGKGMKSNLCSAQQILLMNNPGPSKGGVSGKGKPLQQFNCQTNHLGNEGSGSDESMNSNSLTKDSTSDQEVIPTWTRNRRDGIGAIGDGGGGSSVRTNVVRKKQPPWLEKVDMTPDLIYRYRIPSRDMSDVLRKDLEALKIFGKQSAMVNDQLGMLYHELNFEGNPGMNLNLEEGMTSNSSSGDENCKEGEPRKAKKALTSHQYSKMVYLYEENAPFPPENLSKAAAVSKSEAEV